MQKQMIIEAGLSPLNILTAKGAIQAYVLLCEAIPNEYVTPEQAEQLLYLKTFAQKQAHPLDLIEIAAPPYSAHTARVSLKDDLKAAAQALINALSLNQPPIPPASLSAPPYDPADPDAPSTPPLSLTGQELFWASKAIQMLAPLLTLMDFDDASSLSASQDTQTQIDILLQRVYDNNTLKIEALQDHAEDLIADFTQIGAQIVAESQDETQQVPLTGTVKASFDLAQYENQYLELNGKIHARTDYPLVQQHFPYTGEELKLANSTVRIPKQNNPQTALTQAQKSDLLLRERIPQAPLLHAYDFAAPVLGGVTECGTLLCQSYAESDQVMLFASAAALYRKRKKHGVTEQYMTSQQASSNNPHESTHGLYTEAKLSESTATNSNQTVNPDTFEWSRCSLSLTPRDFLGTLTCPMRKLAQGEGFFVALDIFGRVYSSKDEALTWKNTTLLDPQGSQWTHNGINSPQALYVDGMDVIITSPEYLWISRNGGDTFTNAYHLNVDPTAPQGKRGASLLARAGEYWLAYNPHGTMLDNKSPLFRQKRVIGEPPSPSAPWEKVHNEAINQWATSNPTNKTQFLYQMELIGNRVVLVPNGPSAQILTTQNGTDFLSLQVPAAPASTPAHDPAKASVFPDSTDPTLFNQSAPYYTLLKSGLTGLLVSPNYSRVNNPFVQYAKQNIYFQVLPDPSLATPPGQTTKHSTISIRQDDFLWNTTGETRNKNPNGLSYEDQPAESLFCTALYSNAQRRQEVTYPLHYVTRSPQTGTADTQPHHIFSSTLNYYATIPTSLSLTIGYEFAKARQDASSDFDGMYLNSSSSAIEVQVFPKQFPAIPPSAKLSDSELADSWSMQTPLSMGATPTTGKYLPLRYSSAHTPKGSLTVVKQNNAPFAYVLGFGEDALSSDPNRIKCVPTSMDTAFKDAHIGLVWSSEIDKSPSLIELSKTASALTHNYLCATEVKGLDVLSSQKNTAHLNKTGAELGLSAAAEVQTLGTVNVGLDLYAINKSTQVIILQKLFSTNIQVSKKQINWTPQIATNGQQPPLIMASNHSDLIAIYDPVAQRLFRATIGTLEIDVALAKDMKQVNTMQDVPYGQYITDIQYLNGLFVIVGAYGLIMTSEDLRTFKTYWAPDSRERSHRPPFFQKVGTVGRNLVAFPLMSVTSNWDADYYYISYDNGGNWYAVETKFSARTGGKATPIHIQDCGGHAKVWDAETWGVLIMNAQAFPNDLFKMPIFEGQGGLRKFMRAK